MAKRTNKDLVSEIDLDIPLSAISDVTAIIGIGKKIMAVINMLEDYKAKVDKLEARVRALENKPK